MERAKRRVFRGTPKPPKEPYNIGFNVALMYYIAAIAFNLGGGGGSQAVKPRSTINITRGGKLIRTHNVPKRRIIPYIYILYWVLTTVLRRNSISGGMPWRTKKTETATSSMLFSSVVLPVVSAAPASAGLYLPRRHEAARRGNQWAPEDGGVSARCSVTPLQVVTTLKRVADVRHT